MAKRYRKKPVVVEATQLTLETANEVYDWIIDSGGKVTGASADPSLTIFTLEGEMKAKEYDYIIKGVKGEFYPCKPDVFEQTYDSVSE